MKKLAVIAIFCVSILAKAQDKQLTKVYADKKQSTITYAMNHPLHSWTGKCKEVTSVILTNEKRDVISQVAVSVKIASFDSQNANRDSHAMEVTEALKYPSINFSSNSITPEGDKLLVTGVLQFHGVSKEISFEAEKKMVKGKVEITGGFTILMTDYKVDPPSLMGLATDDEIHITFDVFY